MMTKITDKILADAIGCAALIMGGLPASAASPDIACPETPCHSELCECASFVETPPDAHAITVRPDSVIIDAYRDYAPPVMRTVVFRNMRVLKNPVPTLPEYRFTMDSREYAYDRDRYAGILYTDVTATEDLEEEDEFLVIQVPDSLASPAVRTDVAALLNSDFSPRVKAITEAYALADEMFYLYMVNHPDRIQYFYEQLPELPGLPEDTGTFADYLNRIVLPGVSRDAAVIPEVVPHKVYWLHTVNTALQFSQAYISSNWYQGGTNHLALLFNFGWDVALNTVYKPNLMFQSSLSYKLAINSNSGDAMHKYSIAQDLFQYNLKAGVKAFRKWFYSANLQFKTQFFNAYPADSWVRSAAFLSPADLNVGLGMTYNTEGRHGTLKFSASISPISYNLKACLSDAVDHLQFNIPINAHTRSEIGSNAELTLDWAITPDISWKSRLFLFSDYHYFLADWENTFNFNINRFLSTQLYIHPRFDSSTDAGASSWRHWMLKEILSFGLSYTFSTKP